MNTYRLSNTSIATFREFLRHCGCRYVGITGGHEKWHKEGCTRFVIFQTHIDPIPEFILKSNLRTIGCTRKQFEQWLKSHS